LIIVLLDNINGANQAKIEKKVGLLIGSKPFDPTTTQGCKNNTGEVRIGRRVEEEEEAMIGEG
jgi:hypothetical protein